MARSLDETDYKILRILQERGRITNVDLSREIGLSTAPTLERVRRLESQRVIESYHAQVNKTKMGITITAITHIALLHQQDAGTKRFTDAIRNIPEVVECMQVTGDSDFILRIVCADISDLHKLIGDRISALPDVSQVKTSIVLDITKNSRVLPVLQRF